jgi:hypothetical protein
MTLSTQRDSVRKAGMVFGSLRRLSARRSFLEFDGEELTKEGGSDLFGNRGNAVLDTDRVLGPHRLLERFTRRVNTMECTAAGFLDTFVKVIDRPL